MYRIFTHIKESCCRLSETSHILCINYISIYCTSQYCEIKKINFFYSSYLLCYLCKKWQITQWNVHKCVENEYRNDVGYCTCQIFMIVLKELERFWHVTDILVSYKIEKDMIIYINALDDSFINIPDVATWFIYNFVQTLEHRSLQIGYSLYQLEKITSCTCL